MYLDDIFEDCQNFFTGLEAYRARFPAGLCSYLRNGLRSANLVEDRELVTGGHPIACGASSTAGDAVQHQPQQLGGRLIAGKCPPALLHVMSLMAFVVRDDLPDSRRESAERDNLVPCVVPEGGDRGDLPAFNRSCNTALLTVPPRRLGSLDGGSCVDTALSVAATS